MIEGLPIAQFSVATAGWLLAALFFLSMQRGRIVPRQSLDDAHHDRDEWRAESRLKDAQIAEKDAQLRSLAEVGETQKAVLHAIARLTMRGSG